MLKTEHDVTVLILAGGLGRRVNNQNKGLLLVHGKPLIEYIIDKIKHQTKNIIINANQNTAAYEALGYPVIADKYPDHQGPLAGILSCEHAVTTELVLTIPCDTPLLPEDLLDKMLQTYNSHSPEQLCVVHDGERIQNLFLLFHRTKFAHLAEFFTNNRRKVADWIQSQVYNRCDFSNQKTNFLNINTEENLVALQKVLKSNNKC